MTLAFKELSYTGLDVDLDGVTPEGVEQLLDEHPYIELANQPETKEIKKNLTPINKGEFGDPAILETDCGWIVHYYPPTDKEPARLRASRPLVVSDNIDSALVELTTEHQTMRTAIELYKIMTDQGWDKFKVLSGTPRFTWSTWVVLNFNKQKLTGFTAQASHKHIFEQVKDTIMETMHKEISGQATVREEKESVVEAEVAKAPAKPKDAKAPSKSKDAKVEQEKVGDDGSEVSAGFGDDIGAEVSIPMKPKEEKAPNKGKKRKK